MTDFVALKSPGKQPPSKDDDVVADEVTWNNVPHPLETANLFSFVGVNWMGPLMSKGSKSTLVEENIWPLPHFDTSANQSKSFESHWAEQLELDSPNLALALFRTFKPRIIGSFLLYILSGAILMVQPIMIKSMLQYLTRYDQPNFTTSLGVTNGYALAALLTLLTFVSVTVGDFGQFLTNRLGCNAKIILMDNVFRKILRMSGHAKKTMTTGEIVTMASVDADRLFFGFMLGYWTLISPLMLLAVFILIGNELDWVSGLVGGLFMLLFLYFGFVSGKHVGQIRRHVLGVQSERVKLTNEVLQGIRVVKLYAWEESLAAQLAEIRSRELALLKSYQTHRILNTVFMSVAPVISLAACLMIYVARGFTLTTPLAFTALAYMNIARQPCTVFSTAVMGLSEAWASCQRITKFLVADEIPLLEHSHATTTGSNDESVPVIEISGGNFSWDATSKEVGAVTAAFEELDGQQPSEGAAAIVDMETPPAAITLSNINLHIEPNTLTIVVGSVGSGKSSLISAILGEIHQVSGSHNVQAHFSYVNQEAWIQHATLKQNILFDSPYDDTLYHQVLAACQLETDLSMLPQGDATEIGERGINLSGGQKARVSLARALYHQRANVFLLDDPLSALDVHVANAVFDQCVQGLLKSKTTILVLNSHYHFLPHADRVLVMVDGAIVGDGKFSQLKVDFPHLLSFVEKKPVSDDKQDDGNGDDKKDKKKPESPKQGGGGGGGRGLMDKEDRAKGLVTFNTYKMYFGSSGLVVIVSILVIFTTAQASSAMTDWYMSYWANNVALNSSISTGWYYLLIAISSLVLYYARSIYVLLVAIACSRSLHAKVFNAVVSAPVPTFFDVTPMGRILNRFSSDLDQIDSMLPFFGLMVLQFTFMIFAILVVCAGSTPWILIAYVPIAWVFKWLQQYYNVSSAELKRMDGIARSPVVTLVGEAISGLSTIRAFKMTAQISHKQRIALDRYLSFSFAYTCSGRWFQLRLDWVSSFVITAVAFIAVFTRASIGVTAAGLALTYSSQLSTVLSRMAVFVTFVENMMTSVERLGHFNSLESEDTGHDNTKGLPPSSWPQQGEITFTNYSMRYREHLELVLNNVNFTVKGGEKVGIVGRTGSGKSSLMAALFRMVPSATGTITLDGVDIASISVRTLRSRLTIIPQDPVLFSGSLRFNLDPSHTCSDEELWTALKCVHLDTFVGSLEFAVSEKGSNVSVGQRQLLCIARALLRKSKVVVLDEATANIDLETDRLIQHMIQDGFHGVTRLIIAHRLETILDSDRILVLDAGHVVEFDAPPTLLANPDSAFAHLASKAHVQL
ncbi:hypothetical protein DYB25_006716 [Aphanomyces astaci]|uniref:Uncharacterized protein n=1 Tax=Aphanomyces astaci TaxID=112090 RepID=A0A397BGJ6_APHAT|nr:hypothetical protein DYB25_006716 [Aphanomyces astaci]